MGGWGGFFLFWIRAWIIIKDVLSKNWAKFLWGGGEEEPPNEFLNFLNKLMGEWGIYSLIIYICIAEIGFDEFPPPKLDVNRLLEAVLRKKYQVSNIPNKSLEPSVTHIQWVVEPQSLV